MRLLVLVTTLLLTFPAQADVTSSANATGITIELVDLDPGDGINPAMTMSPAWLENGALRYGLVHLETPSGYERYLVDAPFAATSRSRIDERGEAHASLGGDGVTSTASASGRTDVPGGAFFAHALGIFANFTLTPRTAVVISGDYVLDATQSHECAAICEWTTAQVYSEFYVSSEVVGDRESPFLGDRFGPDSSASRSGQFMARYDNEGFSSVDGRVALYAEVTGAGSSLPLPVPEPSSWLLAALGLGALSIRHRSERTTAVSPLNGYPRSRDMTGLPEGENHLCLADKRA